MKNQSNPLILLHGALGSASQFELLQNVITPHFSDVFCLDFSGHGGSEIPEKPFSIPLFSDDLHRFF